ncbi:dTDP-4-dehydrorhamnose reductase [Microbulbifer sp. ARAS458-1]|uniref:dTDP-4-dehydrorhamnose reductase n=1 Tax=Microbulbifer sp. ARAS458-1 TaxID=3140242 RepID=UPI003877A964
MGTNINRALVFGKSGQVAWELQRTAPVNWKVERLGRAEINLLDPAQVADAIGAYSPDLVINAAAYTAVDKAESDREAAFALNQQAVANIADAVALQERTALVQVSTDFVFDGKSSRPYSCSDETSPLSAYGESKLAGEREVIERQLPRSIVLRTSWVYSSHGNNFVKTMLQLMADPARDRLNVVYDQVGTPTWAYSLAQAIWRAGEQLMESEVVNSGQVFHWTDAGVASWYDFAVAIQELALARGLLERKIPIKPIPHTDYPSPGARPAYSVLDKAPFERAFGVTPEYWRSQLESMLHELAQQEN